MTMYQDPAAMGAPPGAAPAGAAPALPPDAPDPMMDDAPPDPAEMAQLLGGTIAQQREAAHAMVDQAADQDLQQIIAMIEQAAQGGQVLGEGQVA